MQLHTEDGKCCGILCCAVLAGRDKGEPNENLGSVKINRHSDCTVDTAIHRHGLGHEL